MLAALPAHAENATGMGAQGFHPPVKPAPDAPAKEAPPAARGAEQRQHGGPVRPSGR
jgi:hypothetical protein